MFQLSRLQVLALSCPHTRGSRRWRKASVYIFNVISNTDGHVEPLWVLEDRRFLSGCQQTLNKALGQHWGSIFLSFWYFKRLLAGLAFQSSCKCPPQS